MAEKKQEDAKKAVCNQCGAEHDAEARSCPKCGIVLRMD